ncbi:MAG TPA: phosphate ABC transporter substrate-binding/OmpA family protein [Candidatus Angelobacter sp.]|jgi:flagellar motor protein MotB
MGFKKNYPLSYQVILRLGITLGLAFLALISPLQAYILPTLWNVKSSIPGMNRNSDCMSFDKRLRVGIAPWVGFAGGLLEEDGLQEKGIRLVDLEDTDWEVALSGCNNSSKNVDVLWTTIDSWALQYPALAKTAASRNQRPPVAIMEIARSSEGCALMAKPAIKDKLDSQDDGKIGAPAFTTAYTIALREVNRKAVIARNILSADDALQQFRDRQLAAVALCEPYLRRMRALPSVERVDQAREQIFILVARREVVEQERKLLVALAQSWLQGNAESPRRSEQLLAALHKHEANGLSENDTDETLRKEIGDAWSSNSRTHMATLEENQAMFLASRGKITYETQFAEANRRWRIAGETTYASAGESMSIDIVADLTPPANKELCDTGNVLQTVWFDPGKYDVRGLSEEFIEEISGKISEHATAFVCIIGHTDRTGQGDGFDNQKLSEQRAEAVTNYFRNTPDAIPDARMVTLGRADRQLLEKTNGASQLNRRVEIRVVLPKETP